jgi:DNA polymerase-3 subunit epsilon
VKRILILDTETTGLFPEFDHVIEVAAILYSIEHATVLESFSSLAYAASNAAEKINHIPERALIGAPGSNEVWARVEMLAQGADAFVAHRASFDRGFTPEPLRSVLPWVCSKTDLQWPLQSRLSPSLVALALDHGLGVASAHRAMTDCDLLARLFTRARELGTDLVAMLQRGLRPKVEVVARVSYENRHLAKEQGFEWDDYRRVWVRMMPVEDAKALPFGWWADGVQEG